MSEAPPPPSASTREADVLAACVAVLSLFNVLAAFSIAKFQVIFDDLLAGHELPALTTLVLTYRPYLVVLSLAIPAAAIAFLCLRNLRGATYLSVVLAVVAMLQLFLTILAMFKPFTLVLTGMQAMP